MSDKQPADGIAALQRRIQLQEQHIQRRHQRAAHQLHTLQNHVRSRLVAPATLATAFAGGISVGFLGVGGTFGLVRKLQLPRLAGVVAAPVLARVIKDVALNAISDFVESRYRHTPPEH